MARHLQKQEWALTDLYSKIKSLGAKQACLYLLVNSARLEGFRTDSSGAGEKKHFAYRKDDSYQFAFISNADWLLFYFRKPVLDEYINAKESILSTFQFAEENPKGELTVKISTLEAAMAIQDFLENLVNNNT